MDVDHFKAYNDHYDHQPGDEALKTVAQILKDRARRSTDIAARYGGEEFALVLCDTSLENALKIGEDILSQLTEMNVPHQKSPIGRLSFSIGIALAPGDRDYRLELLYKQADQALYRAKSEGRNRVVVFQG